MLNNYDRNRSLVSPCKKVNKEQNKEYLVPINFQNESWRFVDSKGNASLDEEEDNPCEPGKYINK